MWELGVMCVEQKANGDGDEDEYVIEKRAEVEVTERETIAIQ